MNISPKTKLALMRSLRDKKNPLQKGFTLIELMIVVAIVGILSAVALPNFLGARAAASAGAAVGEVVGLAKECATFTASAGVGVAPTTALFTTACTTTGGVIEKTFTTGAVGVQCLGTANVSVAANSTVKVTIGTDAQLTCAFT